MSAFDSMAIEGANAAPAAQPASPFASMKIVDEPFEAPKPADKPSGGVSSAVRNVVGGTADIVDFLFAGTPAMVLGTFAEGVNRLQGAVSGKPRKEVAKRGEELSTGIGQAFGTPLRTALTDIGYLRKDEPGALQKGMGYIAENLERDAASVEERTGGKVLKQDYMMFVNGLMAALGVKGTGFGTRRVLDARKAKAAAVELDKLKAERAVENVAEVEVAEIGPRQPPAAADYKAYQKATPEERAAYTPEQREAMVEFAQARREAKAKARAAFAGDPFIAGRTPRTRPGEKTAVDEAPRDLEISREVPGQDLPAYVQRPSGVYVPAETTPQMRVAAPDALTSGTAKVARGRPFDLTAEERIAIRGSKQIVDPKIATAAIVGATGLGLALALEPSAEEAALAIGAGALIAGRGRGLTLEAIRTMPDATPLGRIVDQMSHTLSTVEVLRKQAGNRFEFRQDTVAQLLRRDGVTGAERAILQDVLDSVPGETITAKQLMEGVKARTGDFELKRAESDSFADYGLERIDRETDLSQQIDAEPWIPEGTAPDVEAQMRATHAAARADAARRTAEPTTTIYQSPVELGTANHFGDPNYFAHTRSFVEDGVKHVVELQSDVAQKAKIETVTPEMQEAIARSNEVQTGAKRFWDGVLYATSRAGNYSFFDGLRSVKKNAADLEAVVGHDDIPMMIEEKLLRNLNEAGAEGSRLADQFYQEWAKGKTPEVIANYERGYVDISDGFIDWALKHEREFTPEVQDALRGVLHRYATSKIADSNVILTENKAKLQTANIAAISPMLKDWHKRLVREELASSAAKGKSTVRFADADTVAKVEGWPTQNDARTRSARESVAAAERNLSEMESRLGTRSGATPAEQAEARQWIPVIREDLKRAQENYAAARDAQAPIFSPEHQGIYDRYAKDVTKFLKALGGKHVVDASGHGWWEVPVEGSKATPAGKRVQQFGGLDADLAKAVAVIGGGAALGSYLSDPENKLSGSIQGAIVGLAALAASRHPGFRDAAKAAGSAAEYGLGLASTRVRNISESLHWRMVKHEGDVLKLSHDALAATEKFSNYLRKLPEASKAKLNRDILSGDFAAVLRQIGADAATLAEWQKVRTTLNDLGERLKGAGKLRELLTDYYPRVVIDAEGLLAALGKEKRTYIDTQLDKARQRAARMGQELTPLEISTIVNRALKSQAQGTGRPGFLKKRSIQEITSELEPFYAPASESLPLYIRSVVREIERAKFFGENLVRDAETGVVDLDTSIGNLVQQERVAKNLTPAQEAELTSILRSRFGPGERSMNKYLQGLKNISYAGLLGHVTSAIPQLADTAMAFYAHGFLPTVKAMQAVSKRAPDRVTVKDVGLADHVVEELTGGTAKPKTILGFQLSSAKFLQKSFKFSGFSLTDQFGKNVHLNAAWTKYRGWAASAPGIERIRAKYGKALGPEFDSLVADLREGKLTERTRTLLFAELSDMQPVSKLEVPQGYLDMPNGRVVYMLKTWMLKQADIVRRDIVQRAARGDKRGALEAGLRFSLILGMSGASVEAIKNPLLGREDPLELSDIPNNVLKTFGWSEYTADRVRQGKLLETGINIALPPYKMWDEILARDPKAINYIPLAGRLLYADNMQDLGISTGFHGAAKANLRTEERRKREDRAARNPEAVRKARERAKAAYEKRLRERERQ